MNHLRLRARGAIVAVAFGAMGLFVASRSATWVSALDLGRRWGRVPAGCYELDHCGLSRGWTLGFLLVVWGLPATAFAVAGWRWAARTRPFLLLRTALLLAVGTVAYHLACEVTFVWVAYR